MGIEIHTYQENWVYSTIRTHLNTCINLTTPIRNARVENTNIIHPAETFKHNGNFNNKKKKTTHNNTNYDYFQNVMTVFWNENIPLTIKKNLHSQAKKTPSNPQTHSIQNI